MVSVGTSILRETSTPTPPPTRSSRYTLVREEPLKVYFADARSSWQPGTNENTYGLLRQYLSKGINLARWGPDDLAGILASAYPAWNVTRISPALAVRSD